MYFGTGIVYHSLGIHLTCITNSIDPDHLRQIRRDLFFMFLKRLK